MMDDGDLNDEEEASVYAPNRCMNVIGYDPEEGDIVCGDACSPSAQMCHFCLTSAHRMTGMF